jgi:hypothetical protein
MKIQEVKNTISEILKSKKVIKIEKINSLDDIVKQSLEPVQIKIKTRHLFTSMQLSYIISSAKIHFEKYSKKLILLDLTESQKNVFQMIKLDDILEY